MHLSICPKCNHNDEISVFTNMKCEIERIKYEILQTSTTMGNVLIRLRLLMAGSV